MGLRERKRLNAMRAIQEHALDLFDERGFAAVTIEEIAAAAEVSPSSVYRYFGTKEGVLVADEFDSMSEEALTTYLDVTDPVGSLLQAVRTY
jgi:AcrR family transcriptional regulator